MRLEDFFLGVIEGNIDFKVVTMYYFKLRFLFLNWNLLFVDIGQGIEDKVLDAVVFQAWSKKLAAPVVELEIPILYGP